MRYVNIFRRDGCDRLHSLTFDHVLPIGNYIHDIRVSGKGEAILNAF